MCRLKRLFLILLVSCVVCCSLLALPGGNQKRYIEVSPQEEVPEMSLTVVSEEQMNSQEISETSLTDTETPAPVEAPVEEVVEVKKADLEEMVAIVDELDATLAEAEDKAAVADASAVAVEKAYNLGFAKAEKKTRAFAMGNVVLGFANGIPQWGLGAEMGIKIGNGLLISAGANYLVGGFTMDTVVQPLNIDRLTVTLGVGWEW